MSKLDPSFVAADPASLADENALLRASLDAARQHIATLEQKSGNDPLTGLPARERFLAELERVVVLAHRHMTNAALLSIDIKGLDAINAAHGRLAGDAVLRHVSHLLQDLIRSTDHLARSAAGEFALILDHLDLDSAIETGDRIARCIAGSPADIGGRLVPVAAWVGVTGIMAGDSVDDVLERAELNMAFAKAN